MSRLGKLPIKIPEKVEAKIADGFIIVKGPKGELKQALNKTVNVAIDGPEIKLSINDTRDKKAKALWGLFWNLIRNMIIGVTTGYEKKLEVIGVGFKTSLSGNKLNLSLGFSHPVIFFLPSGITASIDGNIITIAGYDKQLVGEIAARIRKLRQPEPYKGKGIRYLGEAVRRKEGKAAAKTTK